MKAFQDKNCVQAMKKEISAVNKNETQEMVALPKGKKTVECILVYTLKHKADEALDRYKTRLLA